MTATVSVCLICGNEEEMIGQCLTFIDSIPEITEICIVDSFSQDRTLDIIDNFKTNKLLTLKLKPWVSFGQNRNWCLEGATCDWILIIDSDETYTPQLSCLLRSLDQLTGINAIRVPKIIMVKDRLHYLQPGSGDPQVRVWRNGFGYYRGEIHERVYDASGRDIHCTTPEDADVLYTWGHPKFGDVFIKDHQLLKSDSALQDKSNFWSDHDYYNLSAQRGCPATPSFWADAKRTFAEEKLPLLPERWQDVTSVGKESISSFLGGPGDSYMSTGWLMNDADRCCFLGLFDVLRPLRLVTIGVHDGKDVAALLQVNPRLKVVGIDVEDAQLMSSLLEDSRFEFIKGPSQRLLIPTLKKYHPDVIFIDGDHEYKPVRVDIKNSLKTCPNAVVVGHDWHYPPVRKAAEGLRQRFKKRKFHVLDTSPVVVDTCSSGGFFVFDVEGSNA